MKAGAYDYVMKGELARLCGTIEHGLEEARHRRERRRTEEELRRRDAILEAVRFAADRLLGETIGWEENIRVVLRRLGEATGTSRVYVTENYTGVEGELCSRERHKWVAPGATPETADPLGGSMPIDFPYRDAGLGRWTEVLGRGEPIYGHTREFPTSERPMLVESRGILSIALVPIFVEGRWWGFVGFDECSTEREWSVTEVGGLGAAAGTLGAAIRRKRLDEQLRASEAELRAVFAAMNDFVLVLDGEGRYLKVAPTTSSMLYRPPEELVGRTVHDTFPREQADTILGSIRHSLETQERADIEYGLRVLGQDMWFSATFSPMTQDTVVAVARVITEQAKIRRLLEGRVASLSRVAASLTLDQPMERTLGTLAESMVRASGAVACMVLVSEEATGTFRLIGSHGLPKGYTDAFQAAQHGGLRSRTEEAFRNHRSVVFRDARRMVLDDPVWSPPKPFVASVSWDTLLTLRLDFRDRVVGGIIFYYPPGEEPGEDERAFLQAVADQAAVAVENARLFSETRGKAALEERQRLARGLHDSVSQALYGIALSANAARRELDDGPAEIVEPLEYVLSLAEAGMTEMSALIFELRPESLENEGIVAALKKQAAALEVRHRIDVRTNLCNEPAASIGVKEALYRIAQEALHNTVKHAQAQAVGLRLASVPQQVTLEISDDGLGFDPKQEFPGHLGLGSMRERASSLGGTLEIRSNPGQGTRIVARIPFG
jgi:PAS domain S-box-containing protein